MSGTVHFCRLVFCLPFLYGCATLTHPIEFEPVSSETVADLPDLVEVEGRGPEAILAGDSAPFDGWIIPGRGWARAREDRERMIEALRAAEEGRQLDRAYAVTWSTAQGEALVVAREGQWRAFAAGAGVGVGACGALGMGLALD